MLKGVYCFITLSVDCAKAGVTVLLKPEPSSDLFVDLLGGSHNNRGFYFLFSFHTFYPPIVLFLQQSAPESRS